MFSYMATTEGFREFTSNLTNESDDQHTTLDMFNAGKSNWTQTQTLEEDIAYINTLNSVSDYIWIFLSPVLFCVGMFGNILNIAVLTKMNSWNQPTVLLMIVLAFTDTMAICSGLVRYWIRSAFGVDIRLLSNWGCKINLFVVYLSMQLSSWTRVLITMERYLMTKFPLKYNLLVTMQRVVLLLMSVFVFLVFVNGHFFWTNGLIENGTDCWSLNEEFLYFDEFIFTYVDLVMLSLLPFIIMLSLTIAIVKSLNAAHNRRKSMCGVKSDVTKLRETGVRLTRTLLLTISYFLLATIPISIYFILDSYISKDDDKVQARMDVTWSVSYVFQYSIYTVNFYLYVTLNRQYRKTVARMLGCQLKPLRNDTFISSLRPTEAQRTQ